MSMALRVNVKGLYRVSPATHTHTYMLGFHVLWGLSIEIMIVIL